MSFGMRWFMALFAAGVVCCLILEPAPLLAQKSKLGLSPDDQKKYDELMRSARRSEIIGYVAAGVGLFIVAAAVPLKIYFDRKKKARVTMAPLSRRSTTGISATPPENSDRTPS